MRQFVNCVTAFKGLESAGLHFPADSEGADRLGCLSASLPLARPEAAPHPCHPTPHPGGVQGERSPEHLRSHLAHCSGLPLVSGRFLALLATANPALIFPGIPRALAWASAQMSEKRFSGEQSAMWVGFKSPLVWRC